MRILRLSTFLEGGGAEASIREYLKNLSSSHKITLIYLAGTDNSKEELENKGIKVIKSSFSLRGFAKIIAYYNLFKPDIVHATLYKAEFFALLLKLLFRAKVVVNRDVDFWAFRKSDFLNWLVDIIFHKYILYPFVDRIIAITHHVRNYILNTLGFKSKKVVVVYYGLDFSYVVKGKKRHKKKEVVIGFVGRLVHQKGVDVFLRTLIEMKKPRKKVIVNVYGDGPYHEMIAKVAPNLEEKGIKINLKGFVSNIYEEYGKMDILFLPTQYEGFGLVFIEALSTRKIVILTSNIKPLDEVIGKHGVFCDKRDYMCFARSLYDIIHNLEKYQRVVYKNIEEHLNKFDIKKVSKDLEKVYEEVLIS